MRWVAMVVICVLCVQCCLVAQEVGQAPADGVAKPWESEGSRAGEEITGPDGGTYVWVPAGEFMMGATDGDPSERPVHRVRITRGFWLGKCEVTNAQYKRFCKATGREFPKGSNQGDDHPVVDASWDDAKAYCAHYGLRLPTEAEWEYAARGTKATTYPWGDEWDSAKCCNGDNRGPGGRTHAVGSFPAGASWCGALDLAGSVCEWCADWFAGDYYPESPASDPPGPESGAPGALWVVRGGSWLVNGPAWFRCALRFSVPEFRYNDIGFRCARGPMG